MRLRRDPLLWCAAVLLLLTGMYGAIETSRWRDRQFAGFLVLRNGVVASAGLAHWPGTSDGEIYGRQVTEVDGSSVRGGAEVRAAIAGASEGRSVRYRFGEGEGSFVRSVETRRFAFRDLWLLFGSFMLNGAAFGIVAILTRALRGGDRLGRGTFAFFWLAAMYTFSALDLYGPYRLFRLHVLCESFLFAGTIHMALVFPQSPRLVERFPWLIHVPYGLALPVAVAGQICLDDPERYVVHHGVSMLLFGLAVVGLIASQVHAGLRPASFEARQRVRVVAFGAVAALSPSVGLVVISPLVGLNASQNSMAFTAFLFPAAVAYAVLRHNLLEVDALIRRSVAYAALTLLAALVYGGGVALTHRAFADALDYREPVFAIVFGVVCVGLMLPLRDHAQALIDRLFFRNAYDYRRIVEETSGRLASATELASLSRELHRGVERALHPQGAGLFVRGEGGAMFAVGDAGLLRAPLDVPADRKSVDAADGGLVIPFRSEGELVAALVLGPPRSGGMYSGEDRALLHTLAHQGAVAVRNALALEQLRELNRSLEGKVEARTHDLQKALDELRSTQTQLLHREKMASLGASSGSLGLDSNAPATQGSVSRKRLPWPGALSSEIEPPSSSASRRESASPRPAPPMRRVEEPSTCVKGRKMRSCSSGLIPMPVSVTVNSTASRSPQRALQTESSTWPHSVKRSALPSRFSRICRSRQRSVASSAGAAGGRTSRSSSPRSRACGESVAERSASSASICTCSLCSQSFPASIRDRSRMSFRSRSRWLPLVWIESSARARSSDSSPSSSSWL